MYLSSSVSKDAFERDSGSNGSAVSVLHERSLKGIDSFVLRSEAYEKNGCLKIFSPHF